MEQLWLRQPDRFTFAAMVTWSLMQITLALTVSDFNLGFWCKVMFLGAPLSHGLYVLNLEFAHNLCFGQELLDRSAALLGNLATGLPYAEMVRYFDAEHIAFYGSPLYPDPDEPSDWEKRVVRGPALKMLYLIVYPVIYAYRLLFRRHFTFNRFLVTNVCWQLAFNTLFLQWYGCHAWWYLFFSTYIGFCPLHPCASHLLLHHHYFACHRHSKHTSISEIPKGTFSYYGIVNWFTFHGGLHRERHLDPQVPWSRLPLLTPNAHKPGEFAYDSVLQAIHDFVFMPHLTLESVEGTSRIGGSGEEGFTTSRSKFMFELALEHAPYHPGQA